MGHKLSYVNANWHSLTLYSRTQHQISQKPVQCFSSSVMCTNGQTVQCGIDDHKRVMLSYSPYVPKHKMMSSQSLIFMKIPA